MSKREQGRLFVKRLPGTLRSLFVRLKTWSLRHRERLAIPIIVWLGYVLTLMLYVGVPWWRSVYEGGAIFALEGDVDIEVQFRSDPMSAWVSGWLWLCRLAAPALTGAAVVEYVRNLVRVVPKVPADWSEHFVIVGAGKLGSAVATALRSNQIRVAVIEIDATNIYLDQLRADGVSVIIGDGRDAGVLDRARISEALALISVARDDLTNVSCGLLAISKSANPGRFRSIVHVVNDRVSVRLRKALVPPYSRSLRMLNSYDMAATELVKEMLPAPSPDQTLFVVGGFGRFGQAVLKAILLRPLVAGHEYWIIDPRLDCMPDTMSEWIGFKDVKVRHITENILSEAVSNEIEMTVPRMKNIVVLVCTDDDDDNLAFSLAMHSRLHSEHLKIVLMTRMFEWPESLIQFGNAESVFSGIRPINVFRLIRAGLPATMKRYL